MTRSWIEAALADLEAAGRLRATAPLRAIDATHVILDGRRLVLFGGNDYLGLSHHPEVRAAAARAAQAGMGPRGAALVCGHTASHAALEAELAALEGTEAALLFPTGYQANLAALTALGGAGACIFSDALNHASIVDGCRLARARVEIYRHRDMRDLDRRLRAATERRKIVVTDAIFSMEGTLAPLEALAEIKARHRTLLVTDEAHATLLYPGGAGIVRASELPAGAVDLQVGTLSKAAGALGGFIACSHTMRRWLSNTARTFIFTTALPVPVVEAARASIRVAIREDALRARLWGHVARLGEALGRTLSSPIGSIVIGPDRDALALSHQLMAAGLHVPAIRPPTVPEGTARLRIALSAAHTPEEIGRLCDALRSLGLGG